MANITKNHVQKREDRNAEALLNDLFSEQTDITIEAIPELKDFNTPDYLVNKNIYIEIKEVHDGEETKRSAQWAIITNKLQKYLTENFRSEKIKGLYSIETPRIYKLNGTDKFTRAASEIIEAIKDKKQETISCGIKFKINKVSNKHNEIYLSSSFGSGSINPSGTIYQNIEKKLETANKQLGYCYADYKITKRILLLVNKYIFADRVSEVIEGLSYCYDNLLKYDYIDEIWFQQETRDGEFVHAKVCSRDFLKKFDKRLIEPINPEHQQQFELWYWSLEKMDNKKPQILDALRKFLDKLQPANVFSDPFKRQEMARFGIWLFEQNKDNEAIWLIEKFIDDPDPTEPPKNNSDDPTFNYHKKIQEGDEVSIITTVMGNLAWVVQALARKSTEKDPANLIKAFGFTKRVLTSRENLYTIQQWLIPLIEISNRRIWLLGSNAKLYEDYKKLLIGSNSKDRKNSLVGKYGRYGATAKLLAHCFSYFKDLTTDEVKFVMDNLKAADDDYGALLIYFAIYRPKHYKKGDKIGDKLGEIEPKIRDYDGSYTKKLLKDLIAENKEGHQMQTIAWNFWKILKDTPKEFDNLKEWIDSLFSLEANFSVYPYLQFILEDNMERYPEECINWLDKLFITTENYIKKNDRLAFIQREILHIPKTLTWLEQNKPEYFSTIESKISGMRVDGTLR